MVTAILHTCGIHVGETVKGTQEMVIEGDSG